MMKKFKEKKIISFKSKEKSKKIIINENRKILTIKKTDDGDAINISIIEIKPEDELEEEEFLEFDANLVINNTENEPLEFYLIDYKGKGRKSYSSIGKITKVEKNEIEIEYDKNKPDNSVGCPIFLEKNNKIIAVQGKMNSNGKFNGILLNFLINEYNKKNEKNIINCHQKNEITNDIIKEIENENQKFYKEKILKNQTEPIPGEKLPIIIEQMKKSICKIYMSNERFGTGFFCKIPFPDELNQIRILFTNNHVLDESSIKNGEVIKFTLDNDKIEKKIIIDNTRKTYTNEELDTTMIEIKKSDGINSLLEIDYNLFDSSDEENDCNDKEIYILQYPNGKKYSCSYGRIISLGEYDIQHTCSTERGCSGSPILFLLNFKVVGIHKEGYKNNYNCNLGTLIKVPIKEFIDKFKNDEIDDKNEEKIINIDENEKNAIGIAMKIENKDIFKKINFFGFEEAEIYFNSSKNILNKILSDDMKKQLLILNKENNVKLYVNDEIESNSFKSYFIPKKPGIYIIKVVFNIELECCSGMFYGCSNIIDIGLSNFKNNKCNKNE